MSRHWLIAISCLIGWFLSEVAVGQERPLHHFHTAMLPPGTAAQGQLMRFPALRGYMQPVKILVPDGARVSVPVDGQFDLPRSGPVTASMQVGGVYRLKISSIPFAEGAEIFPTIEIMNRLYPPEGQKLHFPVPVQITQREIELALSGRFVTRVIYLEDPDAALAFADERDTQRYFDVPPGEDPLLAADRLGRPMVILRMGSRVPDADNLSLASDFGTFPLQLYEEPRIESSPTDETEAAAIERYPHRVPRAPLPRFRPPVAGPPTGQILQPTGLIRP